MGETIFLGLNGSRDSFGISKTRFEALVLFEKYAFFGDSEFFQFFAGVFYHRGRSAKIKFLERRDVFRRKEIGYVSLPKTRSIRLAEVFLRDELGKTRSGGTNFILIKNVGDGSDAEYESHSFGVSKMGGFKKLVVQRGETRSGSNETFGNVGLAKGEVAHRAHSGNLRTDFESAKNGASGASFDAFYDENEIPRFGSGTDAIGAFDAWSEIENDIFARLGSERGRRFEYELEDVVRESAFGRELEGGFYDWHALAIKRRRKERRDIVLKYGKKKIPAPGIMPLLGIFHRSPRLRALRVSS